MLILYENRLEMTVTSTRRNYCFYSCFHSRREYLPPEPPEYFDKCYWPNYLKSREVLGCMHDIGL